jgi:5-methylcytosine-specific restriction protein A
MDLPLHRCSSCSRLVAGRCPHCVKTRDHARPNANARGYNSARWLRFRGVQLARFPLCAQCEKDGRITIAIAVDHIRPIDGPDDPRFLDFREVQSLCHRCHSVKTATEDSSFARRT